MRTIPRTQSDIYIYPNPTSGEAVVCGYMYGYTGIELYEHDEEGGETVIPALAGWSIKKPYKVSGVSGILCIFAVCFYYGKHAKASLLHYRIGL